MFFRPRTKPGSDSNAAVDDLQDVGQRSLIRMIFASTGLTLGVFCALQFMAGNYLFASFELVATATLLWGAWRIVRVRNLLPWIYLYLVPTFSFLLYIIVIPNASKTAFVWVYSIPVLSYLLLGLKRGSLLSLPFVIGACLLYLYTYPVQRDAESLIDLGNAVFCGVMILVFVYLYEARRATAYQKLQHMARTDALTGVASRGSFQQSLEQSIREAKRSQAKLVLVVLDIDYFKAVNDQYGHDAGDQALRHICNSLSHRLRSTDTLGRLGGKSLGCCCATPMAAAPNPWWKTCVRNCVANRCVMAARTFPCPPPSALPSGPPMAVAPSSFTAAPTSACIAVKSRAVTAWLVGTVPSMPASNVAAW
ncbi:GGDEF domain-containing protein [Pseudomonas peli]|uniref:GGDEF domain-containing protein n=1 Tax=Pseudomonas peli TaxID=592361 RepID=UPI003D153F0C